MCASAEDTTSGDTAMNRKRKLRASFSVTCTVVATLAATLLVSSTAPYVNPDAVIQKFQRMRNLRRLWAHAPDLNAVSNNYADWYEPFEINDTPVYWHVPKASGTTIENLYSHCLGLVIANEVGGLERFGHAHDDSLTTFPRFDGALFVNVDTSSHAGIDRAKRLHLAESALADVIFTPLIHHAAQMFTPEYKGRAFTLLRHPVDRAVSEFYYLQDATWEPTYAPETKDWTVLEYADRMHPNGHNFMIRMLLNKHQGDINEDDLEEAKQMLGDKFLIGLTNKMEESVSRFDMYFGFEETEDKAKCTANLLGGHGAGSNHHNHPKVLPETPEWDALVKNMYFDILLYDFAVELFEDQGAFIYNNDGEEHAK